MKASAKKPNAKKVLKKKDYLKDFANLNTKKISNYNLDIELNNYLKTMTDLKEDNKELNTDEINELFNKIDNINEILIANKKYYNKISFKPHKRRTSIYGRRKNKGRVKVFDKQLAGFK